MTDLNCVFNMGKISGFFDARTFAVIGASRESEKVGNIIFRNLLSSRRLKVFPVNPVAEEILGEKCYPDVLSIPFKWIDVAVIVVKAEFVSSVLEQCAKKGIKNVVIISAGFSEAGNNEEEKKILDIAKKHEINILGPNVLGYINTYSEINSSFFGKVPKRGKIAFISQSGAVGTSFLDIAISRNLGFSSFLSIGNMLDIDFISALEYYENDKNTDVIVLYIESLKYLTGKRFIEICKRMNKKIIAIKSGKSEKGKKAAQTHTAALASDFRIYSSAFKQSGVIEADSLREAINLAEIFSKYKNLGKKAVVISNAGGLAVLASDACSSSGIELVDIPESFLKDFDRIMPKGYSRNNPLDILGDALAERYRQVIVKLDKESFFDFFIVIVTPQAMTQALETAKILNNLNKPVFPCFVGGNSMDEARKELRNMFNFEDVSDINLLEKVF